VEEVKKIGSLKKASASQIALAWLLHQGNDIVPIPGTTKVKHLEENAKATDIPLNSEDLSTISRILSEIRVSGDRYGEMMRKMVSTD
jgi:aryl-alcohol dehydrogenase-like predicted oxidoreductase